MNAEWSTKDLAQEEMYLPGIEKFPKELRETLAVFCELWHFSVPRSDGNKKFWIGSLYDLKDACGEFGVEALRGYRKDFEKYMVNHNGIAPFMVNSPKSLVNSVMGWTAWHRAGGAK